MSATAVPPGAAADFLSALKVHQNEKRFEAFADNSAWPSGLEFGAGDTPSYYYLDNPTAWQLFKTARFTEIGWRLTYGLTEDEFNNNYKILVDDVESEVLDEHNETYNDYLHDIQYWKEIKKAASFEKEQGEALLFIHRVDTVSLDAERLREPANFDSPILRVEAIHSIDYSINNTAELYTIAFTETGFGKPVYTVHRSHCIRINPRQTDYDVYKCDQAYLKPVFGSINIILGLNNAAGDAGHRWATGIPMFWLKGINSVNELNQKKAAMGHPTRKDFLLLPESWFSKVEMLGTQGQMLNLRELMNQLMDQIVAYCKIPRPVLLGEVAGVQEGSEVNERSYFAVLDAGHQRYEPFCRAFHMVDPMFKAIFGVTDNKIKYRLDWGLRQVMTESDQAALDEKLFQNALLMGPFSTLNEVRKYARRPLFEEVIDAALCTDLYGYTPEELSQMPFDTVKRIFAGGQPAAEEEEEPLTEEAQEAGAGKDPDPEAEKRAREQMKDAIVNYRTLTSLNRTAEVLGVAKGTTVKLLEAVQQ